MKRKPTKGKQRKKRRKVEKNKAKEENIPSKFTITLMLMCAVNKPSLI